MIHALYLGPRLIPARTLRPRAVPRSTHLILQHFEYSPHLRVLAQLDASRSRISKSGRDLLSLNPQAEYEPANCIHQPKRIIPSRLPRGYHSASSRVDDAPGGPVSSGIPRNPRKARIP